MDYEPMRAHYYKYHEEEILKDIEEYVSSTYQGHYTGTKHEFRKVQTIDLMAARDIASQFCQANILKYGSRYGSKDGRNKKDLMKVIHYAMLLLHFDGHYGDHHQCHLEILTKCLNKQIMTMNLCDNTVNHPQRTLQVSIILFL